MGCPNIFIFMYHNFLLSAMMPESYYITVHKKWKQVYLLWFLMYCYVVITNFGAFKQKILLHKKLRHVHQNENIWAPQKIIFTSKARLNSEVYGQAAKITPEAGKKRLLFFKCKLTVHRICWEGFWTVSLFQQIRRVIFGDCPSDVGRHFPENLIKYIYFSLFKNMLARPKI